METLVIVAAKNKTNQMLAEKINGDIIESFAKDDIQLQVGKWTEEKYEDQVTSLSQNNLYIFVGKSKEQAKLQETGNFAYNQAQEAFRKLGMTYAWKGNKALLWIDKKKFADASVEDMIHMFDVSGVDIPEHLKPYILKEKQSLYRTGKGIFKDKKKENSNGGLSPNRWGKVERNVFKAGIVVAAVGASYLVEASYLMDKKKMDSVIDFAYKVLISEFVKKDLNNFVKYMDNL